MTETLIETHPFAHLGPAPYHYRGIFVMPSKALLEANPMAYNAAIAAAPVTVGSCHHCGTGITDHYLVEDGAGKLHAVGSSCVLKLRKPGKKVSQLVYAVMQEKKRRDREKRHAREAIEAEELEALMAAPETKAALEKLPHPHGFVDRETGVEMTGWDYATWMHKNSGASGRGKLLRELKKKLKV